MYEIAYLLSLWGGAVNNMSGNAVGALVCAGGMLVAAGLWWRQERGNR